MKIALFGGTFDPPHKGHLEIVAHLLKEGFDRVWVLPAWRHPFGKKSASFWDRFHLARRAFHSFGPQVMISDVERRLGKERSWTILTVRFLQKKYPQHQFTLVVGQDNYDERQKWFRFNEIEKMVAILPIPRGPQSFVTDVSSTALREKIQKKEPVQDLIPTEMLPLISKIYHH
ncbi:MAG: nicotinate-nicotinamide nucleotide adenylyltransferase [bacterium]|nr:nicotinate-nicotinamide nucleotide adenylyltransferase [bacterium]